jgi:hypothetical protein
MRKLNLGRPTTDVPFWLEKSIREIERASFEDVQAVAEEVELKTYVATRSLDPATATVSDVANFLATFIDDIRNRGRD